MIRALFLSALVLLVSACGWHLRGSGDYGLNLQSVYLQAADSRSEFTELFKRSLINSGVEILTSPAADTVSIYLADETRKRRSISVDTEALASEYELELSTTFRAEKNGELLIPDTQVDVNRTYTYDRDARVAMTEEETLIYSEMRSALVQKIMRRLRFISAGSNSQPDGNTKP